MALFSSLYVHVMRWSRHARAPWFLGGLSFAESSFFPVPPDVMLAPMVLAQPQKAWRYAALTTVMSVLGGAAGYAIGYFALEWIEPWLQSMGYTEKLAQLKEWFAEWGLITILIAGFSPIPYKLFTIMAGILAMNFPLFLIASLAARGARFYLVAGLMAWGGERMEAVLHRYVDYLGWAVVGIVAIWILVRGV